MPHPAIAALDNALGAVGSSDGAGEDMILRRPVGTGTNQRYATVTVRARVTAITDKEISAGISQADLNFIMSPTQINEKQWPGGVPVQIGQFAQDPRIPVAQKDQVICRGRMRTIAFADPVFVGNELVRINGRMTG